MENLTQSCTFATSATPPHVSAGLGALHEKLALWYEQPNTVEVIFKKHCTLATVTVFTKNTKNNLLLPLKRCTLATVIVRTKRTVPVLLALVPVLCVCFQRSLKLEPERKSKNKRKRVMHYPLYFGSVLGRCM